MTHKTPSMRFAWLTLALLSAPVLAITNQSAPGATQPPPQFEVASIKPNKSGDGRVMLSVQPGGRFTATNVTLRMMIRNAYQLQEFQITGGPSWISDDRFDIVAKAEAGDTMGDPFRAEQNGQPSRGQLMIRALLAERFKLVVHNEDKEMPIYALVLARSDGRLGPQLKQSEVDCVALMAAGRGRGRGGPPPGPPPGPGAPPPQCGIRIGPGNMAVGGSPMTQVANSLSMFAGRIVDRQDRSWRELRLHAHVDAGSDAGGRTAAAWRAGAAADRSEWSVAVHRSPGAARTEARFAARPGRDARDRSCGTSNRELKPA